MAIGSRAWSALMRRNLVYRKRHFITTVRLSSVLLLALEIVRTESTNHGAQ